SKPIAVVDPMAVKRDPKSTATAVVLHALVIALILFRIARHVQLAAPANPAVNLVDVSVPPPPPVLPKASTMGGGGGQHDLAPVTQGHLPKFAQTQIVPPMAPPTIPPKLAV